MSPAASCNTLAAIALTGVTYRAWVFLNLHECFHILSPPASSLPQLRRRCCALLKQPLLHVATGGLVRCWDLGEAEVISCEKRTIKAAGSVGRSYEDGSCFGKDLTHANALGSTHVTCDCHTTTDLLPHVSVYVHSRVMKKHAAYTLCV